MLAMLRARGVAVGDAADVRRWVTERAAVLRTFGAPVLVVAALIGLAVVALRAGGSGPPRLTAEFPDVSGGRYLDVQLDESVKRFGAFSAFLPGEGRVWPRARVAATRTNAGAVDLSYDGAGYLDAASRADGTTSAQEFRPRRVRLRLVGRVGPADSKASVHLWVNGRHWRIVSAPRAGAAEPVVRQFLRAVKDHDWNRVYDLSGRYMRNGVPQSKFVIGIGAGAANRITDVEAVAPTRYTTTAAGVRYARVPMRLTYGTGTGMITVDATLVLAVDTGGWKVLGVE